MRLKACLKGSGALVWIRLRLLGCGGLVSSNWQPITSLMLELCVLFGNASWENWGKGISGRDDGIGPDGSRLIESWFVFVWIDSARLRM